MSIQKRKGGLVGAVMFDDGTKNETADNLVTTKNAETVGGDLVATKKQSIKHVAERVKEIDPLKCRLWFFADRPDDEASHSKDIAQSFIDVEQLNPVIVRPLDLNDPQYPEIEYEVIAGSVRWRAARQAGVPLKAFVRSLSDKEALAVMLIENEQRKSISEFARALQISKVWVSGMFESKGDLAAAHAMDNSKVSRYLKVAENEALLRDIFGSEIKNIGLRQLYQTVTGEQEEGEASGDVKKPVPATKKQITSFVYSFDKIGVTTIRYPKKLSEDKLDRIKEIMEEE
jgi:ParB/RepB/Spo0J family partition protein